MVRPLAIPGPDNHHNDIMRCKFSLTGSRLRLWIERCVCIVLAVLLLQTWCLEVMTISAQRSDSMARTVGKCSTS